MSQVAESETEETQVTLMEAVRLLGSESQRAVLSYALFLQQQEEQTRRIEANEAEWDRLFNDPEKMANLTKWADECAQQPDEPMDESRL